jgi:hypothetical protein
MAVTSTLVFIERAAFRLQTAAVGLMLAFR